MSGFGVLAAWANTTVPVVVFSGSANPLDMNHALELGACEFVQKPTDFNAYQEAVRELIARWGHAKRNRTRMQN